jgi:hypothetical protein
VTGRDPLIKIATAGKLPNFTWLQPQSTTYGQSLCNWQHPDASVIEGKKVSQLFKCAWNNVVGSRTGTVSA